VASPQLQQGVREHAADRGHTSIVRKTPKVISLAGWLLYRYDMGFDQRGKSAMPFHLRNSHLTRVRLSDRIGAVFQAACMTGELDTAADLLVVLRNVRERGHRAFGVEKRISDDPVVKAQEELATRLLVKRQPVPAPVWR
jgi:hypothetical protein